MLFYTFILFAMGVQSQEILQFDTLVAENATNINNQTCEAKVNTYMSKMMDRTFNEATPKIEENVINATKLMLEQTLLPEISLELRKNLSIELRNQANQTENRLKNIINEK